MSDDRPHRIEAGRADLIELATRGAKEMLAADELAQKRLEHDGTPEQQRETYGVIARRTWDGWRGEVIGTLPGADGPTIVKGARTQDGVLALCYRAYLGTLVNGRQCGLEAARARVANTDFYVATVL